MNRQKIGRLALRVEGDDWKAYYAPPDTMRGATFLGSIKMRFVQNETHKKMFMDLMRMAMADLIEETIGERPDWEEPKTAPFWEQKDG
jgi:hypothetical protein